MLAATAACGPRHVTGHFVTPGVAEGELQKGDLAYACDAERERCSLGTVRSSNATVVHFYYPDYPQERGFDRPLADVIPKSRIAIGDVVEDRQGNWFVVGSMSSAAVFNTDASEQLTFKELELPTARADALDRHDRRLTIGLGIVMTAFAVFLLWLARRFQVKGRDLETVEYAHITAEANGEAPPIAKLEVLRCTACNTPVPLVAHDHIACPGCGAAVAIPHAYVELVTSRAAIVERLPREAAALMRARILGNPLVGLLTIVGGYAVFKGFGAIMHAVLSQTTGNSTGLAIVAVNPLLYLPLGLFVAGGGQLLGGRALAKCVPALAASRDDKGYTCRGCGAPLASTRDGVGEVCGYCGVQNLIASKLAASARESVGTARALGASIRSASAAFWGRVFRLLVPPLYVVGAIAIVLYPIILIVGLTL